MRAGGIGNRRIRVWAVTLAAAAGFAHKTKGMTRLQRKAYIAYDTHEPFVGLEGDRQALNGEKLLRYRCGALSIRSQVGLADHSKTQRGK